MLVLAEIELYFFFFHSGLNGAVLWIYAEKSVDNIEMFSL